MKIRKALTLIVGMAQGMIAVFMVIFVCILYFNLFDVQTLLNMAVESCDVLAFLVFGLFSLISGLFLVHEWLESR